MLVAVIALIAGIGGAVAGGVGSYLGNRSLERTKSHAAARGSARVLTSRMTSAGLHLQLMLQQKRLLPIDSAFRISLPLEDAKLIATNVTADQWAIVADTLAGLEIFATRDDSDARRASAGLDVKLDESGRDELQGTSAGLQRAQAALNPLRGRISNACSVGKPRIPEFERSIKARYVNLG